MSRVSTQVKVYISEEILNKGQQEYDLYGLYHMSTNQYNILSHTSAELHGKHLDYLGHIYMDEGNITRRDGLGLVGYYSNDGKLNLETNKGKSCIIEPYSLKMDILSRNTGILESDLMLTKRAIFVGCGSVGSFVALQLAKAGVGHFLLIDEDIFAYHNICRHQCGIYDVGKYKVDALKERILQINPEADVIVSNCMLQEMRLSCFEDFCNADTIVIGGADNRAGNLYACKLAKEGGAPFVAIGCWHRAFAGEVFYTLPSGMPDYSDLVYALGGLADKKVEAHKFYVDQDNLDKVSFEPGISADIDFVSLVGVKLILDLLNRGNVGYTQRLLPHLSQYTLVCNTNAPEVGGEDAEIFTYPLQVTTSIYVPYKEK